MVQQKQQQQAATPNDGDWLGAEVARLQRTRHRVGPRLQALRQEQDSDDMR